MILITTVKGYCPSIRFESFHQMPPAKRNDNAARVTNHAIEETSSTGAGLRDPHVMHSRDPENRKFLNVTYLGGKSRESRGKASGSVGEEGEMEKVGRKWAGDLKNDWQ
ncbi:hypothetical protein KM043_013966 [Ampulex compressa]|nr:hypothetical protein KM043_013966 [Ampulex compressa]